VGVGVPVCLIYIGIQSLFRALSGKDRFIFAADILFSVIAALISFFFMVFYNNGRVRLHLIMGEALGFFVFMRTVGKHLLALCFPAADTARKVLGKMLYPFVRVGSAFVNIFRNAGDFVRRMIRKRSSKGISVEEIDKKTPDKAKKINFISKILLKIQNKSV